MTDRVIGGVAILALGPPRTEIALTGDIDLTARVPIRDLICQVRESGSVVHIDAGRLAFIDASGLGALTELALCTGRRPVLSNPPPILRFLLRVTRLEEVFTIVWPQDEPRGASLGPAEDVSGDIGKAAAR